MSGAMAERELIFSTISSIHGSFVLEQLLAQYNDGRNCDLEVRLKTKQRLYVHKFLVDIFMAEVGAELENDRFYLDLEKYEEPVIAPLIDMMYTGELRVQMDQVDLVCDAAEFVGYSQAQKGCQFYTSSFTKPKEPTSDPTPAPQQPIVKQEPIEALFTQANSVSRPRTKTRPIPNTVVSSAQNIASGAVTSALNPVLGNNVRVITIPAGRGAPITAGPRATHPALKQMPLSSFLIRGNAGVPLLNGVLPVSVPPGTRLVTPGSIANLQNASIIASGQRHFVNLIQAPSGAALVRGSVPSTVTSSNALIVNNTVRNSNSVTVVNSNAATKVVAGRSVRPSQEVAKAGKRSESLLDMAGSHKLAVKQSSLDKLTRKLLKRNSSGATELGQGDADGSLNKTKSGAKNVPLKPCSVALEKIPAHGSKCTKVGRPRGRKKRKADSDDDSDDYIDDRQFESLDRLQNESNTNRRSTRQKRVVNYNQIEETYKELDEDLSDAASDCPTQNEKTSQDSDCLKDLPSTDSPSSSTQQRKRSASKESKKKGRNKHKRRSEIHKVAQDLANVIDEIRDSPGKSKRRSESIVEAPDSSDDGDEGNKDSSRNSSQCRRRSETENETQNVSLTDKPSSIQQSKFKENGVTKATPLAKLPPKNPQGRPGEGTTYYLCHPVNPIMKP